MSVSAAMNINEIPNPNAIPLGEPFDPTQGFPSNFSIGLYEITPESALFLLKKNGINRSISDNAVEMLVSDIQNGHWTINGESIKFDKNGRLLDGQHRLTAIVKANIPISTLITFGLETHSIHTLDTQKRRGACDVLKLHEYKNTFLLAGILKLIITYPNVINKPQSAIHVVRVTNSEVLEYAQNNPNVIKDLERVFHYTTHINLLIPGSQFFAAYRVIREYSNVDEITIEGFFSALAQGFDSGKYGKTNYENALKLRKFFSDNALKRKSTRIRNPHNFFFLHILNMWNQTMQSKEVKRIPNLVAKVPEIIPDYKK